MNRKALVVIDIQNDITKRYRDIIDRLNAAIEWAAESGMEIVYIQHNNLSAGTRTFKPGTKGAELVPELKIVSDHIFVKTKANALTSEKFSEFIRSKDIREFYITGADATGCVKSTCFNMTKAGYAVHVISDCVTSYDLKKMPGMLAYYADKGCEVKDLAIYMGIQYQYKRLDKKVSQVIHWMILSAARLLQSVGERQAAIGSLCRMSMKKTGHRRNAGKWQKKWRIISTMTRPALARSTASGSLAL